MFSGIIHIRRLLGLVRGLARQDALWVLAVAGVPRPVYWAAKLLWRRRRLGRRGERLARALTDLGPSFIKLGQALSVRADLVGEELAADLSQLQDRLPPFAFAAAKTTMEKDLSAPLDDLFQNFEENPVAAASIAQVHRAVTTDGRTVAVKILRPGIEEKFARDLALFRWLAAWGERRFPRTRRLRPVAVVDTFRRWTEREMDLRLEGAAACEMAETCGGEEGFRIPAVDWDRTGQRVLTTEWVEGCRIDDVAALRQAGFDVDRILETSVRVLFLQIFRDGFFHADIHPGNMFVDGDGVLVPVDFGIMGRVDRRVLRFLSEMMIGFLKGDYRQVAEAHFDAGIVPPHHDREDFAQALRAIGAPLRDRPLEEISVGRLLTQLFRTTEAFDMETQPDLLLLQKTLLTAEGVGRVLNPKVNMLVLLRPMIKDWIVATQGPEARLREGMEEFARLATQLPTLLERAVIALEKLAEENSPKQKK